ncbi:MAG: PAS domain-containing protein [Deltaproteobacteria bacterium]|nr:PAS domain-containing protein [Deltaproteobacteria bacterium]
MGAKKRLTFLIFIMTTVSLLVAGITIYLIYGTAFEEERARLVEIAQSQARLIEAVSRFDHALARTAPDSYPHGAEVATLSQVRAAHRNYKGFGKSGEFTLARRHGDSIFFLLRHRHSDLDQPKPLPLDSKLSEPMRRALSGMSGTVVGLDYRGEPVLAAYEPVKELNWGIVAKIDLAEVREPFVKAGMTAICAGLLVVILGALVFVRVSNPMVVRLQESEERFRQLAENIKGVFWLGSPDWSQVIYISPAYQNTWGRSCQSLYENPRSWLDAVAEEDREQVKGAIPKEERLAELSEVIFPHYRIMRPDKSLRWIAARAFPIRNERGGEVYRIAGFAEDITERVKVEKELEESQQLLREKFAELDHLYRTAPVGLCFMDTQLRFLRVNQKLAAINGKPVSEHIGRTLNDIIPGLTSKIEPVYRQVIESGEPILNFEVHGVTPGEPEMPRHWLMSYYPLKSEEGSVQGVSTVVQDITELKEAEAELKWELKINAALSALYKPLISPYSSIKDIAIIILDLAKRMTDSEHGYVSSIDPRTGDNLGHTLTEMMGDQCKVSSEDERIAFPLGEDGTYHGLWGYCLNSLEPFFSNSVETHPASTGVPEGHIPLERFLSVPVALAGELVGQIALANKRENYTGLDLEAIRRLAEFYALAIQRARAEEALQQAHDELEMRVDKRTAELVEAYEKLKQSEQELRVLSSQLLTVQEQERSRIARELHDGIGQSLSSIKFRVEDALGQINKDLTASGVKSLNNLIPLIQNTVEEVRRITMDLRPSTLDDLGILATIAWFCRELQETYSRVEVKREISIKETEVPEPLKIVIYRVLQEALNNAVKHSGAGRVTISLDKKNNTIQLAIEDNGCGFDLDEALSVDRSGRGFGLASMRERIDLSGGHFSIETGRGKGTAVKGSWKC